MYNFKREVPQGVNDELSDYYEIKDKLILEIKNIFKSYGYKQICTPTIEYLDVFSRIGSTVIKDEMFKLIDSSGEILVLRPDMTVPITRMVTSRKKFNDDLLKYFYVSKVYRMNKNHQGKRREITQAGIEFFGNEKLDADGEVIAIAIKTLLNEVSDFHIEIGHTDFYKGLFEEVNADNNIKSQLKKLIENKNFTEIERFLEKLNIREDVKDILVKVPGLYGDFENIIDKAKEMCLNKKMEKALEDLKSVYEILKDYGYSNFVSVDLGLINYLDYYTGIIFKGYMANYGQIILSGGRYDKLTKEFGHSIPATGFGINIDELLRGLLTINKLKHKRYYTDYLILYTPKNRREVFQIAEKLRKNAFIVETRLLNKRFKDYINYASANRVRWVMKYSDERVIVIDNKKNSSETINTRRFIKEIDTKENQNLVMPIH
ncbi:ATP phosphoribosyltransferase regulatory subunit [Thermohalobacter berrensis]|uniref:ATP phosphoribosyltransferase regulatory subunit n=1 Tax=Thermohalobacter berrensis TaxID=99594 RepID=A0A419T631_9FIRM|nr:ATP phosphoribosyltransferase regulatory subunit [Thermohalobacter berrensis]RKD32921.1 ATP phosphoribosyltransferase regulatory subunit [Thermohalobacter berrensis]